jgi:HAD superfamily hydrolase (TIGR01509 family)
MVLSDTVNKEWLQSDLVIFDCDGVLVDSEMIASRVLARALSDLGYGLSAEDSRRRFTGMSMASVVEDVERDWGRALPGDFAQTIRMMDQEAFAGELQPVAGIAETIARIPTAKCVASSGAPEKIRHSLSITGLLDLFAPHLFSAAMVANGKPAPDLFLFAAQSMGVAPGSCVVVEDSTAGVHAGLAAGMRVLGFAGASHAGPGYGDRLRQAGASVVFEDMARLPSLL